jgi:uncharacterized membrane-anchored protein
MKTRLLGLIAAGLLTTATAGHAADQPLTTEQVIKLTEGLKYQQGEITLPGGFAKLSVPTNFNYLGPDDAETVLVKLWNNPPSKKKLLGLLMPADRTPLQRDCWVVTIDYVDDGFVKDDDAAKINYDDLLKKMQKGFQENNRIRTANGYPALDLVGWAAPPRYDAATHKLYWAKELKVAGQDWDTLNYDIRMLGRRGVLVLSAVAGMEQFDEIKEETPQILGMVNFDQGSRYADFDPKVDKVATYGLAALVAGGVAAKLGFFKLIWVAILALKKFIIIGVVAVTAWLKKLFGRNKSPAE